MIIKHIYDVDPKSVMRIPIHTKKSVGFRWFTTGSAAPGVVLPDGSATEGAKHNIAQKGEIIEAVNWTDESAKLTLYVPTKRLTASN